MSTPKPVDHIDWREVLDKLEPYFHSRGGFVHISGPAGAGAVALIDHIRWEFFTRHNVLVPKLDPSFPNTRDPHSFMDEAEKVLGLRTSEDLESKQVTINVASSNEVGRDLSVGDISVELNLGDRQLQARVKDFYNQLRLYTVQKRLAILCYAEPRVPWPTQTLYWLRLLWSQCVVELVASGAVVFFLETTMLDRRPELPEPDLVMELPRVFANEELTHAKEDLAKILGVFFPDETPELITVRCETVLDSSGQRPEVVRAQVQGLRLKRNLVASL